MLALVNGGVVLYFLALMLIDRHPNRLALCTLLMSAAYLALTILLTEEATQDRPEADEARENM